VKNKFLKYGVANKEIDEIAKDIVEKLAIVVNGKPNQKGGVYRLGTFSIDNRWAHGAKTAATADGRKKGETLSQNASATFGADKQGATAHLISVANIDATRTPNGTVADIYLHYSAVAGENGLNAMLSSLKTCFDLGGFCVHYNVLNTETLKKAKDNPELYPNLQVRLCGWNVLFNTLSEHEKEEFITRAQYGEAQ
jgi:formate C-acetyltransferase